jgi:hypothetical protein
MDVGTVFYTPDAFRNANQWSIRIDHELRPGKDRIYGSYFRTVNNTSPAACAPTSMRRRRRPLLRKSELYPYVQSGMMNELRVGVTQLGGRPKCASTSKFPASTSPAPPVFSGALYPSGWWQTNYHYKDVFTWVHGSHNIKIGGEIRHARRQRPEHRNYIPTYGFASLPGFRRRRSAHHEPPGEPVTRHSRDAVLSRCAYRVGGLCAGRLEGSRNLTLNLGLRYENMGTYYDKDGTLRNFLLGTGDQLLQRSSPPARSIWCRRCTRRTGTTSTRVGFAWDPTGKAVMTVRGGFGISNNRLATLPDRKLSRQSASAGADHARLAVRHHVHYSLGDPAKPYRGLSGGRGPESSGLDERNGIKGAAWASPRWIRICARLTCTTGSWACSAKSTNVWLRSTTSLPPDITCSTP